jgi:hypothetical protein
MAAGCNGAAEQFELSRRTAHKATPGDATATGGDTSGAQTAPGERGEQKENLAAAAQPVEPEFDRAGVTERTRKLSQHTGSGRRSHDGTDAVGKER